jgi:hypothetical protein
MEHKYILGAVVISVVLIIKYMGKIESNTTCLMFFINKMFLQCFFQLHVSALTMINLQVDHFSFVRQTIQLALLTVCLYVLTMLIVWFAL